MSGIVNKYRQSQHYCTGKVTEEFWRGDTRIYRHRDDVEMIATIIDADPGRSDIGKQLHDCPNCGAVTTIEALERGGCPFCWTQFLMSDLCPKISNYHLRPIPYKIGRENQKRFHRRVLWGAVLAGFALCAWGFALRWGRIRRLGRPRTVRVGLRPRPARR